MAVTSPSDVYYDPYDVAIDADPYPTFRRLREEAPLYVNAPHDFYAVSRFEDVERGLKDPAALARLEGRVALDEVLPRFPEWEVESERAALAPTSTVRGWETLMIPTETTGDEVH